ncbi:hypothetical protein Tco_0519802 [Tanacetum coccineum]
MEVRKLKAGALSLYKHGAGIDGKKVSLFTQVERAKIYWVIPHDFPIGIPPLGLLHLESAAAFLALGCSVAQPEVDKTPSNVWLWAKPIQLSLLKTYPWKTMGYSFYYPPENKVFVARNVEFFENSLITLEVSGSIEDLEIIQEEDMHPSIDTSLHHEEDDQEINEPQSDINLIRTGLPRTCSVQERLCLHVRCLEEH